MHPDVLLIAIPILFTTPSGIFRVHMVYVERVERTTLVNSTLPEKARNVEVACQSLFHLVHQRCKVFNLGSSST